MNNLLVVEDLRVTYGGVTAVDGVSLTAAEGEIVGLIGPNGAGKSSLIDALTGYHPAAGGQVTFAGLPLRGARPYAIARRGLIRTFQSVELFDDLTVEENLLVAAEQPSTWSVLRDLVAPPRTRRNENVAWAIDACGLEDVTGRMPGQLSHGRRKLVGVARALAMRPRLVLMDEPAAGLDNDESMAFGERVAALPGRGVSVLLVDHDMGLVLSLCDRIVVIDFGRVIASGTPEEIRDSRPVVEAYLGTHGGDHERI
jgi:branched-chain amino acid transport system ATP-binding protein